MEKQKQYYRLKGNQLILIGHPVHPVYSFRSFSPLLFPLGSWAYIRHTMLSKVIQEMVEKKYGSAIRYPRDCHALALHISQTCKTNISASTIKRLYGFVKGIEQPRLFTLDVISMYLGYKGWEELAGELNITKPDTGFIELQELIVGKLKKGEQVHLGYGAGKEIQLEYLGKQQFRVMASNDTKTGARDIFSLGKAVLHYPITVTGFTKGTKNVGNFTLGGISGLTHIRKMKE